MFVSLSHKVYRAEQVRQHEPEAAKRSQCCLYSLMQRAGQAAYDLMRKQWPEARNILVLVGNGNNGGDGYIVAKLALEQGLNPCLCAAKEQSIPTGDALTARQQWLAAGGRIQPWQSQQFDQFDVIVDAMLGTGLTDPVRSPYTELIQAVNHANTAVLSIDMPSGIEANSGAALGMAVQAQHTITFVGIKQGLTTAAGRQASGKLHFASLGVGAAFEHLAASSATLVALSRLTPLPPRIDNSHKGHYGRILCIGGNRGMAGAIRLSAEAALRAGAGLVKVYCHPHSVLPVSAGRAELMVAAEDLASMLCWASCIVLGPGLGQDAWGQQTYQQVKAYIQAQHKPVVMDADALHLLAQEPLDNPLPQLVVTPHPGEAARILGQDIRTIQADRFAAVTRLCQRLQAVVVLKGAGTLIADERDCYVLQEGNPGMATAGMGDVLTGLIAAMLVQGMSVSQATLYAASLHSAAADILARTEGQRGMLASDLFPIVRQLINQ